MSFLIQKLRLQRGWSQQQLAELSGLSTRTVQRIEGGQKATAESLKSLAAVFEIDFQELRAAEDPTPQDALGTTAASPPVPVEPPAMIDNPASAAHASAHPSAHPTSPSSASSTMHPSDASRAPRLAMSDEEISAFRYVRRLRGFYHHLAIYAIVITGLTIFNLWRTPERLWVLGPALGWGIGIVAHGLSVFGSGRLFGVEWERRQIEKRLGRKLAVALVVVAGAMSVAAPDDVHAAGFRQLELADADGPIVIALWYPSAASTSVVKMGPVEQTVAVGAPVAGEHLPLIVVSHGTGGSSLSHVDTAIALADAGFVVAAMAHPGDNYRDNSRAHRIDGRMRHVSAVLDHVLKASPLAAQIDPSHIGVFGMSAGGYTALRLVGGASDLTKVAAHCRDHPQHFVCGVAAGRGNDSAGASATASARDARIKAAVVAAPALGFTFDARSLEAIDMPVQLWRAEADIVLPEPYYVEAVRRSMPKADYRVVKGAGHYDFLAPCSAALAAIAKPICEPTAGFDRMAFKGDFNRDVVAFFRKVLSREGPSHEVKAR